MNIILYKYSDMPDVVCKELRESMTLSNVHFLEETSRKIPRVDVKYFGSDIIDYKYAYIEELKGYYFINNHININKEIWRLECEIDYLMTHQDDILNGEIFCTRSKTFGNPLLADDLDNFTPTENVRIYKFNDGDMGDKFNFNFNLQNVNNNLVINVVNNQTPVHTESQFNPPINILPKVNNNMTGRELLNDIYVYSASNLDLSEIYEETEVSFIKSLVAFPFQISLDVDSGGTPNQYSLFLGDSEFNNVKLYKPEYNDIGYFTIFDMDFTNLFDLSKYYHLEPYTRYEIFIPYVGYQTITSTDFRNSRILITYSVNYQTGKGVCYLINYTRGYIIKEWDCQIGVQIPVSRSNMEEINQQAWSAVGSSAMSAIAGSLMMAFGGPMGMVGGMTTMLIGGASGVTKVAQLNERGNVSITNGQSGAYNPWKVELRVTSKNIVDNNGIEELFGRPTLKLCYPKDIKGYCQATYFHSPQLNDREAYEYINQSFIKGLHITND